jgi:hypothetical protein
VPGLGRLRSEMCFHWKRCRPPTSSSGEAHYQITLELVDLVPLQLAAVALRRRRQVLDDLDNVLGQLC